MHFTRPIKLVALAALTAVSAIPAAGQEAGYQSPESIADQVLATLTVRQKVAQLVVPWLPGRYAAFDAEALEDARMWVDSLEVGGIVISIGSPLDIAAKLNFLQTRSRLPLLIASDLEAGTAIRLVGGTPFPRNMGVAAAGSELDAYEVGRISALEARAVGIHLAFAPVADVNNNPLNPIINVRSYGEDPHRVSDLVTAEIRGMQEHGLFATAKHFPGHGDTGNDSHVSLPVVQADRARLDSVELVPFRAAIAAGVEAVMSAHVALPEFTGNGSPATLAPEVLTELLRDSLGFEGMVITDALNMGAVIASVGEGEASVQALLAGSDMLLYPADPRLAIDAVAQAVAEGRISPERLDRSVRRMLLLKVRQGLFDSRTVSLDRVAQVVGSQPFLDIARDITQRSLVLLKDSAGVVDSMRAGPRPVSVIAISKEGQESLGIRLTLDLREAGYPVKLFRLWPSSGPASYDSARAVIRESPTTVFVAAIRPVAGEEDIDLPEPAVELIETTARWNPSIVVSFGSPYIISHTPSVSGYLLAWVNRRSNEEAVARALSGAAAISGRSPISIPPDYRMGDGIQREPR